MLLQRAFEAGAMQVMAEVAPDNLASIRVVQRWGFERVGARTDHDNEHLVQWAKDRAT